MRCTRVEARVERVSFRERIAASGGAFGSVNSAIKARERPRMIKRARSRRRKGVFEVRGRRREGHPFLIERKTHLSSEKERLDTRWRPSPASTRSAAAGDKDATPHARRGEKKGGGVEERRDERWFDRKASLSNSLDSRENRKKVQESE